MYPLVALIYCSRTEGALRQGGDAIPTLLRRARELNAENAITGIICFNREYVLQYIEGGRDRVNQTYARILRDPRHSQVTLLDYRYISRRAFRDWSMGYISAGQLSRETNLMYSAGENFDPFQFSGESAFLFAQEAGQMAGNGTTED